MDCQDPLFYAMALQRLPGVGPLLTRQIEQRFGNPWALFHASGADLDHAQLPWDLVQQVLEWQAAPRQHPLSVQTLQDLEWLDAQTDVRVISRSHDDYPPLLREISNPPPLLYVRGQIETLRSPQLAIVGARKASRAGCRQAQFFAQRLAMLGMTITSGLALGIDAASHRAALSVGAPTIAFVATGIDRCYPHRHRQLAADIASAGAIVSEFPLGCAPKRDHFPRRNRLISGASMGVLVVEAARQSGSLITARYALEQSREVFAVPGSIQNPLSRGCNALLKQGAKLAESVEDIVEELQGFNGWYAQQSATESAPIPEPSSHTRELFESPHSLSEDEKTLLDSMAYEPLSMDELVLSSGLASSVVASTLVNLEIYGLVESRGSLYQRC